MTPNIIQGYAKEAASLIPRYEAISPSDLYSPVLYLLPEAPSRIIDIGAGTGRDAAWFASQGHQVLAVEPVAAFRDAGTTLHPNSSVEWLDDTLPLLKRVIDRADLFDLTLLSGVWHHLTSRQRQTSMENVRLITATDALLIISIRQGLNAPARPGYELSSDETINLAEVNGFKLVLIQERKSVQSQNLAAGVTWTWLAFKKEQT
jgi:SAM-dependent methyltransferase